MSLQKFNRILTFLRYVKGYTYKQVATYFENVHGMCKDEFERMSDEADRLGS